MDTLDFDIESEAQKIDQKIKKLQEQKAQLKERLEQEKNQNELARKVGKLILTKFEGKSFEYQTLKTLLDEKLTSDFDRQFFGLSPLTDDDPRKPKKRGVPKGTKRKKKEEVSA